MVPIYETDSAEQAEWILSNSAARAVIVETDAFEDDDHATRGTGFPRSSTCGGSPPTCRQLSRAGPA